MVSGIGTTDITSAIVYDMDLLKKNMQTHFPGWKLYEDQPTKGVMANIKGYVQMQVNIITWFRLLKTFLYKFGFTTMKYRFTLIVVILNIETITNSTVKKAFTWQTKSPKIHWPKFISDTSIRIRFSDSKKSAIAKLPMKTLPLVFTLFPL